MKFQEKSLILDKSITNNNFWKQTTLIQIKKKQIKNEPFNKQFKIQQSNQNNKKQINSLKNQTVLFQHKIQVLLNIKLLLKIVAQLKIYQEKLQLQNKKGQGSEIIHFQLILFQ
ncbi:unnamed protein product [Paramecium primaurelia]|uniref:Uncharacterized protein n=1 Tax=Paramecium primaurelia TaxID=5886 RepID=A0A8S1KCM2_PARPR|nr:unnamed protein product [Paramecium primaurelia]